MKNNETNMKHIVKRITIGYQHDIRNAQITMWHRGTSWYIGIKRANEGYNTIRHCGSERYIRGVWRRDYA
jgi:chitinase